MARLEGRTIAVTGPRKAEELGRMIEKFGGRAVMRPAQGTVFLDDTHIADQLQAMVLDPPDWLVLTTGVGTEALLQTAAGLGFEAKLLAVMREMRIAARGYKTVNALRKLGLAPAVRDNDGTTAGLLEEMKPFDLRGKRVALQLYGDPAPRLTGALSARGAVCEELLPYRHIPPESDVVGRLIGEIAAGEVDAVAFTSTVQVRYVMGCAAKLKRLDAVWDAFATRVLAVAVGKVTAEALLEEGVRRVLVPEEERMGSMVVAMSRHFGGRPGTDAAAEGETGAAAESADPADAAATGLCAGGTAPPAPTGRGMGVASGPASPDEPGGLPLGDASRSGTRQRIDP